MGYFVGSYQEAHYVEPWEDRLESCIVICLIEVNFRGEQAMGYTRTLPRTTTGFAFEWDRIQQKYIYREGMGFLARWDTGEFMLIIPIEPDVEEVDDSPYERWSADAES